MKVKLYDLSFSAYVPVKHIYLANGRCITDPTWSDIETYGDYHIFKIIPILDGDAYRVVPSLDIYLFAEGV